MQSTCLQDLKFAAAELTFNFSQAYSVRLCGSVVANVLTCSARACSPCACGQVLGMMRSPAPLPVQFADLAGGAWPAALQVVAALYQRDTPTAIAGGGDGRGESDEASVAHRLIEVNMTVRGENALPRLHPCSPLYVHPLYVYPSGRRPSAYSRAVSTAYANSPLSAAAPFPSHQPALKIGAHAALALPLARLAADPASRVGSGRDLLTANSAAYGVFECAPEATPSSTGGGGSSGAKAAPTFLAIGALEPHFWGRLCGSGLVEGLDGDWALGDALANRAAKAQLAAGLRAKTAAQWEALLVAKGVPVTAVVAPEASAARVKALTGTPTTVTVPLLRGGGSGEGQSERCGEGLVLPRMPLAIGSPALEAAPTLGANNGGELFRK